MKYIAVLCASLIFSGCASVLDPWVYKINIQQGNVVDEEQLNALEVGMTKEQVAFVLGSPIIKDTFHTNRWDYVYRFKSSRGKVTTDDLYVVFENNRLVKIEGSYKVKYKEKAVAASKESVANN